LNDNNFDVAFDRGADTSKRNAAINVVQAAIDDWNRVITDFQYGNGSNEFDVTITMAPTGRTDNKLSALTNASKDLNGNNLLDSAGKPVTTTVGKPQSAAISVTWDSVPDSGTVIDGWYLDPTPNDLSEFQALGTDTAPETTGPVGFENRTDAYFGLVPGGTHGELFGLDFFSTVEHELGHAVGLSDFPQIANSTVAHTADTPPGQMDVPNKSGFLWICTF
jgi:hypothetical protein